MTASLNETPSANRIHIGFYGKRNSGKSSLINAFSGQVISIVSDEAGTTTDPVTKAMEIAGLGPCLLIDTAGFDDIGKLGELRVDKTRDVSSKTDIAVILFTDMNIDLEKKWYSYFRDKSTPVILVINKADILDNVNQLRQKIADEIGVSPIIASAIDGTGLDVLKEALLRALPEDYDARSITGNLVTRGDVVLLVMPQDIQAPKGRLILPQMQTIRELLDKKCIVVSCTTDEIENALSKLSAPPKLIITDSQAFKEVYEHKPEESKLTSFSILFAAYKGDIDYYKKSVAKLDELSENSRVLIAECCTHAPLGEDIGRVKIPRLLKQRFGANMDISVVSGTDFPEDLSAYDLIIQCGACMFNRKYVMSRIDRAKEQGIPMTNYGILLETLLLP